MSGFNALSPELRCIKKILKPTRLEWTHRQTAKAQASLCNRAVLPEHSLFTHTCMKLEEACPTGWLHMHIYLRNKFCFSEVHGRMNAMGHVQSKWHTKGVMLTLHGTHCIHTSMNRRKMKFISYIYTLFLHYFTLFVEFFLNLANRRWRKVIIQRVWLLCSTAVTMTWHQSNVTSANQQLLLHLSMM